MRVGVPGLLRKVLKAKPPPVSIVEPTPEAYEPVTVEGLLQRVRSHGDRDARRWARGVAQQHSSLSPKRHEKRKKKNKAARKARRRN